MNGADDRYHGGSTDKPQHSSSVPLRGANQYCSYYERNKDLDLDFQKFNFAWSRMFLRDPN